MADHSPIPLPAINSPCFYGLIQTHLPFSFLSHLKQNESCLWQIIKMLGVEFR